MSRRPAAVTQAEVERMIRAAKAQGLPVVRIVARRGGVSIETAVDSRDKDEEPAPPPKPEGIVL